jgi:hypothetical protein
MRSIPRAVSALALVVGCGTARAPAYQMYQGMLIYCPEDACPDQVELRVATDEWLSLFAARADVAPQDARAHLALLTVTFRADAGPCRAGLQAGREAWVEYRGGCLADTAYTHELAHYLRSRLRGGGDPEHADVAWWGAAETARARMEAARRWCEQPTQGR